MATVMVTISPVFWSSHRFRSEKSQVPRFYDYGSNPVVSNNSNDAQIQRLRGVDYSQ